MNLRCRCFGHDFVRARHYTAYDGALCDSYVCLRCGRFICSMTGPGRLVSGPTVSATPLPANLSPVPDVHKDGAA